MIEFREAELADLPTIVALLADDPLGATREQASRVPERAYRDAFAAIERDPNNQLVVGEAEGQVVAVLQLTLIPHLTYRGGWRAQVEGVRGNGNNRILIACAVAGERDRYQGLVRVIRWNAQRIGHTPGTGRRKPDSQIGGIAGIKHRARDIVRNDAERGGRCHHIVHMQHSRAVIGNNYRLVGCFSNGNVAEIQIHRENRYFRFGSRHGSAGQRDRHYRESGVIRGNRKLAIPAAQINRCKPDNRLAGGPRCKRVS